MAGDMIEKTVAFLAENDYEFSRNEDLKKHCSFKIGGVAAVFCVVKNREQLKELLGFVCSNNIPALILGRGTNVLFCDDGYNGLIIKLGGDFCEIKTEGTKIKAGAAASLKDICVTAQSNALSGLEFAYGIPAGLGGALYMNAGAYNGEMRDVVECVEYMKPSGEIIFIERESLGYAYRTSVFQSMSGCILSAELKLKKGNANEIEAAMQSFWQRRNDKQPLDYPSAGSAFKRPAGAFAAQLIDECGLRGFSVGGAAISEKHTGFIVNLGAATCNDVVKLADKVSEIVEEKTGYKLEREIRVMGANEVCVK